MVFNEAVFNGYGECSWVYLVEIDELCQTCIRFELRLGLWECFVSQDDFRLASLACH